MYLALNHDDDRPLIIDQPEENLDPKSIFDEWVERFRAATCDPQRLTDGWLFAGLPIPAPAGGVASTAPISARRLKPVLGDRLSSNGSFGRPIPREAHVRQPSGPSRGAR